MPNILWSLGLLFGWLLAFPLNGPILYSLTVFENIDHVFWGLVFTCSHALSLLIMGLLLKSHKSWKKMMIVGNVATVILTITIKLLNFEFWPVVMAGLGWSSAIFVLGWSYPYTKGVTNGNRIRIMAGIIVMANLFYYGIKLGAMFLPVEFIFWISVSPLFLILFFSFQKNYYKINTEKEDEKKHSFPYPLVALLSLVVFVLYINGGLMYNVIAPEFKEYQKISLYIGDLIYIGTLLLMWFYGQKISRVFPVFMGASLTGLAFVTFGLLYGSFTGFLLTETFIQTSIALFDLFLWTILGDISGLYGRPFKIFGFTLAANLVGIFSGGLIGNAFLKLNNYRLLTSMLAFISIFISFVLIHFLNTRIEKDIIKKIKMSKEKDKYSLSESFRGRVPGFMDLTPREQEITDLLLEGYLNREIAAKLNITDNTVKAHLRHIYFKIGVANKGELLSLVLNAYNKV